VLIFLYFDAVKLHLKIQAARMITCQKSLFKIPDEVSYINCAYMSPQMRSVETIGKDMLSRKNQPWYIRTEDFFQPVETLKTLFAVLIGAQEKDRISVIPSASYGLASAAQNISLAPGEEILVTEGQFPSNYYTWERICRSQHGVLRVVPAPSAGEGRGARWNAAILEAISEKTRVVALPHVHWTDGTLFDLETISKKVHAKGGLLVIDGTQSVGALPFNVAKIQPDALICAGYKWLMGPYSIGLAYYGAAFDNGRPIEENWLNRLGSEDFTRLIDYQDTYKPMASRYSMGEQSQFVLGPMLSAALEQILEWGVPAIQEYTGALLDPLIPALKDLGCQVEAPEWRGNHLLGLRLGHRIQADVLKQQLAENQVMVSFRGDAVRIAPHVFNTPDDMEKLLRCFQAAT